MKLTAADRQIKLVDNEPAPYPRCSRKGEFTRRCEAAGFGGSTIRQRMEKYGMTFDEALAMPKMTRQEGATGYKGKRR